MENSFPSEDGPASATAGTRRVFVRDLVLEMRIGVYQHEQEQRQRVRINIDLAVPERLPLYDRLADVVSYEAVVVGVRALVAEGHINLVETLAERIAMLCLEDSRVRSARVRVEKLDVFPDTASVGIELERISSFE